MADDELVVEIEKIDDANLAGAVDPAKAKGADKEKPDPIADLKAQHEELLARERTGRIAAQTETQSERNARIAAEQERDAIRSEAADTQLSAIEQGLAAAETASDAAETEYASAMEAGDWKRAAKAQRSLADARAEANTLKSAKADAELRKAQPAQRTEQRQTQPAFDPVERFISMAGVDRNGQPVARTSTAQNWMREHLEVVQGAVGDPRKMMKLSAADSDAVAEGLTRDTPDYFAHVEKFLGIKKAAATNGADNGAQKQNGTQRKSQAAPVAPVQNSGGGMQGGDQPVRLTAAEAQAATDGTHVWNYDDKSPQQRFKKGDPIGIQEFARRKRQMQKDGRYDPMNYQQ